MVAGARSRIRCENTRHLREHRSDRRFDSCYIRLHGNGRMEHIERLLEKLAPLDVVAKPMFGEYGLYFKGKNFGLVCDNTLFIKVTEPGR